MISKELTNEYCLNALEDSAINQIKYYFSSEHSEDNEYFIVLSIIKKCEDTKEALKKYLK